MGNAILVSVEVAPITVRDLVEKIAATCGLTLRYTGDHPVFWKKASKETLPRWRRNSRQARSKPVGQSPRPVSRPASSHLFSLDGAIEAACVPTTFSCRAPIVIQAFYNGWREVK
ncbi:MAG: hypothetical protein ACREJ2_15340 [Planctomycetota bacterium]